MGKLKTWVLKNIGDEIRQSLEGAVLWIALVFIILVFVLVYAFFEKCLNWPAIAALGSILVVVWAVFQQVIIRWHKRPRLKIAPYRQDPDDFRQVPEGEGSQAPMGYYVNLKLTNVGETVAYNVQPHVTGFWRFKKETWSREQGWLPVALRWVLDELAEQANRKPTEEKNLVPKRPYYFNLLNMSTRHPDIFMLLVISTPNSQKPEHGLGKYCFEVTVTAENAKPFRQYYEVNFREGGCNYDYDSVRKKIPIRSMNNPPS